ncbi:MAG: imidazole glycerol phosphate synthase subunit HisH [Verrucomicrobiota bacterium]
MKVGVLDYAAGNLRSVLNALKSLEADATLVTKPDQIDAVDTLVLPGQGAFGDCVGNLVSQGLFQPVRDWIHAGKPYLGICIGYQILFEASEESPGTEGLGVLPGKVVHFPRESDLKIPHMGWNNLSLTNPDDDLWSGVPENPHVYFVHSYYPTPTDNSVVAATSEYALPFAAAVRRGNLAATQFHPEKSQATGLQLLKNYLTKIAPA